MPPPGFAERFGLPSPPVRPELSPAEKEARGQTLLYALGAAVTLAGLVLLLGMVLDLTVAVLTYAFAAGLGLVTLVLALRTGVRQVLAPLAIASAVIGGVAAVVATESWDIGPVVGTVMATAVVALAVGLGRRWDMPEVAVWVSCFLAVAHVIGIRPSVLVLVGAVCLLGTLGRPWPTQQTVVAAAAAFMLVVNAAPRSGTAALVLVVVTLAAGAVLVNVVRALPAPRAAGAPPRPPGRLPTAGEVGAQPWHLHVILFSAAWLGSVLSSGIAPWTSLAVAGAAVLVGLALPEPPGAVPPPRDLRDVLVAVGIATLSISLAAGLVDSDVEHLLLVVLAILVQVRPFGRAGISWVVRGLPVLLAFIVTLPTSVGIWTAPEVFVGDVRHLSAIGLLALLGVAMMVFRHTDSEPVADGIRLVIGLYLAGYALVAGAALIGAQVGAMEGGFLLGHAAASVGWMAFAAAVALRRGSTTPQADLTVAVVVAVAASGKLILFDMQQLGGVARVAAFLASGLIMLGIAYVRQSRSGPPTGGGGPAVASPPEAPRGPAPHWQQVPPTPEQSRPPGPPPPHRAPPPHQYPPPRSGPEGAPHADRH